MKLNIKLPAAVEATMLVLEHALGQQRVVERLWERDASLWHPSAETQAAIARRLSWLDAPSAASAEQARALAMASDGPTLLLAPDDAGGAARLWLDRGTEQVALLDSWAPEAVRLALERRRRQTIIAADRPSPGFDALLAATGSRREHTSFTALGPPALLGRLGSRSRELAAPEGGARFGALGSYGLLAAALAGRNLEAIVENARTALDACRGAPGANPGLRLGAALAALAQHGYDLLFVSAAPAERRLAEWTAGILAGALAKHGRGCVPIPVSNGQATPLGPNTAQIVLRAPRFAPAAVPAMPWLEYELADDGDGAYVAVWHIAVAITAVVIGVNPFDEPDTIALERRLEQRVAGGKAVELGAFPPASGDLPAAAAQARWLALVPYFDRNASELEVQRSALERRCAKPVAVVEPLRHGWATQLLHAGRPGGFALALAPPAGDDAALHRLARARFALDVEAWRRMGRAYGVPPSISN